jgi:hypothetical protein
MTGCHAGGRRSAADFASLNSGNACCIAQQFGASVSMNREDAMTREQVERLWFVRFATALMVCAIAVGTVPLLKNTFFPTQQARR